MKKATLIEIILGTIGGLIFAIGICMCLLPEWNMFTIGIIVSIISFIVLLCIIPVYNKEHLKENKSVNSSLILTIIIGIFGALIMGFGMSKIMANNASSFDMILGIITGIIGLIVCVLNYPVYAYLKK